MGTAIETWPDGRRYLSAAAPALGTHPYPGLGWTVLVRLDEETTFADARRMGLRAMAVGLVSSLLFSWVIWWAMGRKLRPMERLSQAVADLDVNRPLVSLPEVAGSGEVAVFARSMARLVNALGESRERFQMLFDHAPVAMAFVGSDGKVLLLNTRFTQLLGYDIRHVPHVDQWFVQAFPEGPAREAARGRWHQALPHIGKTPMALPTNEYELRCFDGSTCIAESGGIALPDGMLVSFQDLTERRRAETGLRLWAEAFKHSEVGLLISDVQTETLIAANPAFAQQRGYTARELTGLPVARLYPERAMPGLKAALDSAYVDDHIVCETEHIARDGRTFPVLIDLTVLRDAEGRPGRRVSYVQDLTERERAAQEIRRLNTELEQRVVERTITKSCTKECIGSGVANKGNEAEIRVQNVDPLVKAVTDRSQIVQTNSWLIARASEGSDTLIQ